MNLEEEDRLLALIDKKNLSNLSNKLAHRTRWKWFQDHQITNQPLNKKIEQREHIQELERERSQHFCLYNIIRTQLRVIPKIEINSSDYIEISFYGTRPSKKPHVTFSFPHENYQQFIKDMDPVNHQILFCFNNSHFVFNSFPTCVFHVPKCDSLEELRVIVNRSKRQTIKSKRTKRIIKTQHIIKDILFYTLTETEEPPYQAEKSTGWRSQDSIYQDLHPLIHDFYHHHRIKKMKRGDETIFYDEFYKKWLKFDFYPMMFDSTRWYYNSFNSKLPKKIIKSVSLE